MSIKKHLIVLFFLLFCYLPIFSMDILYAPMHIYRDDLVEDDLQKEKVFSDQLLNQLQMLDTRKVLAFTVSREPIRSLMQAAEQATASTKELVIYSKLLKTKDAYELDLTVYDHSQKMILKKFFTKYEISESDALINECAKRAVDYLYGKLGISDIPIRKYWAGNGLLVQTFWIAGISGSTNIMDDVLGGNAEIFFQPDQWWIDNRQNYIFFRWAIGVQYYFALSKANVQKFTDNIVSLQLPWTIGLAWDQQEIGLSLIPGFRFDIADQSPAYQPKQVSMATAFTLGLRLNWLYWFDKNRKLGISVQDQCNLSFYDPIFIENQIGVGLVIGLN